MATVIAYHETHHFELKGRVPSKKNSKRRVQRGRNTFMVPSEAHEAWHDVQMWALRDQWAKNLAPLPRIERCEIVFYAPDERKADLSNKAESIMDLLVDAGVLRDDSWFVVPHLDLSMAGVDRKNPRALIHLYA